MPIKAWIIGVLLHLICTVVFLVAFFGVDEKFLSSTGEESFANSRLNGEEYEFPTYLPANQVLAIKNRCSVLTRKPVFDKLVFMVIDAFRKDFMPLPSNFYQNNKHFLPISSSMPYTRALLESKKAMSFISLAQTPTVTMPRLKALLAGIKPHFIDLIINLNTAQFGVDNLIEQAKAKGKRMIFYGDDTWLQMFPRAYFLRANETFSFFATDYTEVDDNVTRNLIPELDRLDQWDAIFLHYLGVDHIGHTYGPYSHLLPPKLNEMDSVIRTVHQRISKQSDSYLFMITGDHGMSDSGNHGGSSSPESETALIFVNSKAKDGMQQLSIPPKIKQIDIAVTLSLFLGIPIPQKSYGKLIIPVIEQWSNDSSRTLCFLLQNSLQIQKLSPESHDRNRLLAEAVNKHYKSLSENSKSLFKAAQRDYESFLDETQDHLLSSSDQNSIFSMIIQVFFVSLEILIAYSVCRAEMYLPNSVYKSIELDQSLLLVSIFILISHIIFLGSTSFVEMEKFFWNYTCNTVVLLNFFHLLNHRKVTFTRLLHLSTLPLELVQKLVAHLFLILVLNVTNRWDTIRSDFLDSWMDRKEYKHTGAVIMIASFSLISLLSSKSRFSKQQCIMASGLLFVYLYRCDSNFLAISRFPILSLIPRLNPIFKVRVAFLHMILLIAQTVLKKRRLDFRWGFIEDLVPQRAHRINDSPTSILRSFMLAWILLITLLVRPSNIPLVTLMIVMERALFMISRWSITKESTIYFLVVYLTFAFQSFFSQGNSNAISTIDVAAGYVGLESFNPIVTGLLMSCHTYGLFTFWIIMMFLRVAELKTSLWFIETSEAIDSISRFLVINQCQRLIFFQIVAFILRNHLFIWSVISPKLLYESFQCLVIFLICNVVALCDKMT